MGSDERPDYKIAKSWGYKEARWVSRGIFGEWSLAELAMDWAGNWVGTFRVVTEGEIVSSGHFVDRPVEIQEDEKNSHLQSEPVRTKGFTKLHHRLWGQQEQERDPALHQLSAHKEHLDTAQSFLISSPQRENSQGACDELRPDHQMHQAHDLILERLALQIAESEHKHD